VLKDTQLAPEYLELLITESTAINESSYIHEVLQDIKDLGISISIDDFGTEYSSLSRLTSMPIDRIKMDMQFVRGISRSDKEKAIAIGIIGLAHNLGLKVIAEGVETELQLNFLSEKSCDEIQGFYFYRPINSEDFENVLRESVYTY
jgi:EAL domain-containing protein (putative c-di-GMP-specific phosphodiesterase class I)